MPPNRGSAFIGPATAQRPRRRSAHDLCEGCGHFRSEHPSGQVCRHDDCPCPVMGWSPPAPVRSHTKTQITDEIKLQMESLLQSGMNYRKVAATVGCSISAVRTHFPGYGKNGQADVEAHRQIFKYYQRRRAEADQLIKEHKK
jgi:hypothetical protein